MQMTLRLGDMRHGSSSPRRLAHRESALRRSLTEPRRATATRTAPPPPPLVAHMHILVPSDDGGYEAFVEDMFDGLPPVCCIESLSESTGGIEEWDIAGPSARDVESAEYLSDSENSDASEWSDDAPGPSTRHRLGFDISYENTPQWAVAGPSAPPDERPIHEPSPVHFAVDEGDQDETEWDRRSASSEYQHLPQNEPSESSDAEKNRIWQDLPCFNSWKIGKETRVSGPVVVPTKRKMSTQERKEQLEKGCVYMCGQDGCRRIFERVQECRRHQDTHIRERQFSCPASNCFRKYGRRDTLLRHINKDHVEEEQMLRRQLIGRPVDSTPMPPHIQLGPVWDIQSGEEVRRVVGV